jgi:poly-gamma-glutamate capsule biosynthesis protein CapA/YwtB (metallophosphatase superfamily)
VLGALVSLPLGASGCGLGKTRMGAIRITLAGQALMTHPLCMEPYDGFDSIIAELKRGDVVFSDLELAIRTPDSGAPTRDTQFLHVAPPAVLTCLGAMGINTLALSNNHAWDLGTAGVLATREAVRRMGFTAAGTGRNIEEASSAATIKTGNSTVAVIAMATAKIRDGAAATSTRAGVNELRLEDGQPHTDDADRILKSIAAARRAADTVIVYHHNHDWGDDMRITRPWAVAWAERCADVGADIYVSHGAPLLHGIALHKNSPLLFGLGSLVFHSITEIGHYRPEVWESAIVHVEQIRGRIRSIEVVPLVLNEKGDDPSRQEETRGRPRIARAADASRILARLAAQCAEFDVDLFVDGERGFVQV